MKKVTVIREERGMSLVEWQDDENIPQRHWVKSALVLERSGKTGQVKAPQQGYPYGVDLGHILVPNVTGTDISRELRKRGLWTAEDMQKNPNVIRGALQAAYAIDLTQVIAKAKQYEQLTEE